MDIPISTHRSRNSAVVMRAFEKRLSLYTCGLQQLPLARAHQNNDRAVMQSYGMSIKDTTESGCVAELMRRYQALTEPR